MADTLYALRGRLHDGPSWEQIGYPCPELSTCKADAERFTEHYSCIEVGRARAERSMLLRYR